MYFSFFPTILYDINRDGNPQNVPLITAFTSIDTKLTDDITYYSFYDIQDGDRPDNVSQKLYDTPNHYWTFFVVNAHLKNSYNDWPKGNAFFSEWVDSKYSNLAAITQATVTAEDNIFGKFNIGETVTGQLSGATGTVVRKYPTLGFIEIQPSTGTFNPAGEGILGITTQDSLTAASIVKKSLAPHHHIDNSTKERTKRRVAGTSPVTFFQYEQERELKNSRIKVIKPALIQSVIDDFRREMR